MINVLDLGGEFPRLDLPGEGLELERLVRMVAHKGMMVAEVGSWKGASTAVLAKVARQYNGLVVVVDHFLGSPGVELHEIAKGQDIQAIFWANMTLLRCAEFIRVVKRPSKVAVKGFKDEAFDLVFIDADHRYSEISADIKVWFPKVKTGGILCGHDCDGYFSKYSPEEQAYIKEWSGQDYKLQLGNRDGKGYHCGVLRALYEAFGDKYEVMPNSSIWYLRKAQEEKNAG